METESGVIKRGKEIGMGDRVILDMQKRMEKLEVELFEQKSAKEAAEKMIVAMKEEMRREKAEEITVTAGREREWYEGLVGLMEGERRVTEGKAERTDAERLTRTTNFLMDLNMLLTGFRHSARISDAGQAGKYAAELEKVMGEAMKYICDM